MNNDNDLNLHLHDQMSGWLRHCKIRYILCQITPQGEKHYGIFEMAKRSICYEDRKPN